MIDKIALVAAVTLPIWNIPMMMRIIKRRSSEDISLAWVFGVWISFLLMMPQGIRSEDFVWKCFNIANTIVFTMVVAVVVFYRFKHKKDAGGSQ